MWPETPLQLFHSDRTKCPPFVLQCLRIERCIVRVSTITGVIVSIMVIAGVAAGYGRSGTAATSMFLVMFATIAFAWGGIIAIRVRLRRIARAVNTECHVLCWHCGYSLQGAPRETGYCPECGALFDSDKLRGDWQRWTSATLGI